MPKGLKRYQHAGDLHFITFSCYERRAYFGASTARDLFVETLHRTRLLYPFEIVGFVVMPEHVHLLVSELREGALASAIRSLKQSIGQRSRHKPFWYPHYYDFNVFSAQKESEKLDYMHFNPVKRGLCVTPEEWRWSSAGGSRSARMPTASALPLTIGHPESPDPEPWGAPLSTRS